MKPDVFENPVELHAADSAPHFADRHVVQRAQRVVPLEQIREKQRLRRMWFLGGAFAVALMLGAASALVAVQIKRLTAHNQIPQVEEPDVTVTPEAQTLPLPTDSIADSTVVEEVTPVKPIITAPKRPTSVAERPRSVNRDRESLTRVGVRPSEEEQLQQIREQVLYDRWQERRLRRAARRERRNRGDRDLSHLDEIFEGTRRPERP